MSWHFHRSYGKWVRRMRMWLVLTAAAGGDHKPQETIAESDGSDQRSSGECGPSSRRNAGPESRDKHPECGDATYPDSDSPQTEVSPLPSSSNCLIALSALVTE